MVIKNTNQIKLFIQFYPNFIGKNIEKKENFSNEFQKLLLTFHQVLDFEIECLQNIFKRLSISET